MHGVSYTVNTLRNGEYSVRIDTRRCLSRSRRRRRRRRAALRRRLMQIQGREIGGVIT